MNNDELKTTESFFEGFPFSMDIWRENYKAPNDITIYDTFQRLAKAAASVEKSPIKHEVQTKFYEYLSKLQFIAGGRIMANLGVPGRKSTTLYNCFPYETKIHTDNGIYEAGKLVNKTVNCLSQDGIYRKTKWKSYGKQQIYKLILENGDELFATGEHEWVIRENHGRGFNRIYTKNMKGKQIPVQGLSNFVYNEDEWLKGVQNGLVFGDGWLYMGGKYASIAQYGDNKHLISEYFTNFNLSELNSDKSKRATKLPAALKSLPKLTESKSYLRGFLAGFIASDGCVDRGGNVGVFQASKDVILYVQQICNIIGIPTTKITKFDRTKPIIIKEKLCISCKPMWRLGFVRQYMQDEHLIIKNHHKKYMFKNKASKKYFSVKVIDVVKTDRIEEVYCCEEPETHTIVIENCYLTGQCFVHHPKDIKLKDPDSIHGIYSMLEAQAHTLKSEGGYGINASWIRPAGMFVSGIGSRTPGALTFMELWDVSSKIITQGSTKVLGEKRADEKDKIRKGAQMLILDVWHPDIEEFITAKQTPNRLTKFNMSVGITTGFMNAVVKNKDWDLIYPDTQHDRYEHEWFGDIEDWKSKGYPFKVYKTIKAVDLWETIMKSTYNRAEPGVIFLDLANELNPLSYIEKIFTTNPCVTGDTLIAVADGRNAVSIKQLYDENKPVPVYTIKDGKVIIGDATTIIKTQLNAEIVKITFDDGSSLKCTPNHKIMLRNGDYVEAKDLTIHQSLMPFNSIKVKNYRQIKSNIGRDRRQYRMIAVANEDVYDMIVPGTNNFGIITSNKDEKYIESSGIFIHNCGEIPMSTGVCNLGSLNLTQFIKLEDNKITFDYDTFIDAIKWGVRFLDNVNDIAPVPLKEYKDQIIAKRRIGLGMMGLGSLHFMLGIRYGSKESLKLIKKIAKIKAETELLASAALGKEKGSFPIFNKTEHFNSHWWKHLDISDEVKIQVEHIGHMRNSHQSMLAPNGNSGAFAYCISGGPEPVFLEEYYRWKIVSTMEIRDLQSKGLVFPDAHKQEWFETDVFKFITRGDEQILKGSFNGIDFEIDKNRGLVKAELIQDYGWKFAKEFYGDKIEQMKKDGIFATTEGLGVSDHIDTLKILSHYTNQAISKTINIPNNYPYEDFKKIYMDAWRSGIKGITTYRAGTMTAVLESKEQKNSISMASAPKRPTVLDSHIYSITVQGVKFVIAIGLHNGAPYEIFGGHMNGLNFKFKMKDGKISRVKRGVYKLEIGEDISVENFSEVFTPTEQIMFRLSSGLLRHGVPVKFVVEQLQKAEDDITSLGAAAARVLKNYIKDGEKVTGIACPECHSENLVYEQGCNKCLNCGWSKCS